MRETSISGFVFVRSCSKMSKLQEVCKIAPVKSDSNHKLNMLPEQVSDPDRISEHQANHILFKLNKYQSSISSNIFCPLRYKHKLCPQLTTPSTFWHRGFKFPKKAGERI